MLMDYYVLIILMHWHLSYPLSCTYSDLNGYFIYEYVHDDVFVLPLAFSQLASHERHGIDASRMDERCHVTAAAM